MKDKIKVPTKGPTDEPGQQPTPDGDALAEVEGVSAGAGLSLVDVANALRSTGGSNSREQLDRAFTRDLSDVDIGLHEGMRFQQLRMISSAVTIDNVLNFVNGAKAMDKQSIAHMRDSDDAFYGGLAKADATFQQSMLKSDGLKTDNEVITTAALAGIVKELVGEVATIKNAILNAE